MPAMEKLESSREVPFTLLTLVSCSVNCNHEGLQETMLQRRLEQDCPQVATGHLQLLFPQKGATSPFPSIKYPRLLYYLDRGINTPGNGSSRCPGPERPQGTHDAQPRGSNSKDRLILSHDGHTSRVLYHRESAQDSGPTVAMETLGSFTNQGAHPTLGIWGVISLSDLSLSSMALRSMEAVALCLAAPVASARNIGCGTR
jgi:hypothetical protein